MVHMVTHYWLTHKKYSYSIIQLLINCLFFIYFLNIEAIKYHLLKDSKSTTIWVFPMYLISSPKHREPATCICLYLLFISSILDQYTHVFNQTKSKNMQFIKYIIYLYAIRVYILFKLISEKPSNTLRQTASLFTNKYLYVGNNMEILIYFHKKK